jgi:hypothetical protein
MVSLGLPGTAERVNDTVLLRMNPAHVAPAAIIAVARPRNPGTQSGEQDLEFPPNLRMLVHISVPRSVADGTACDRRGGDRDPRGARQDDSPGVAFFRGVERR